MLDPKDPSTYIELRRLWEHFASSEGSTADAVHSAMTEAILTGALPPAARLAEEKLASAFSLSRTPVREALMRLESEQLASRHPRIGLVVATITQEEILEIYVVREVMDGVAARLASQMRNPLDLNRMTQINDRIGALAQLREPTADDISSMAKLNLDFHEALARASRNRIVLRFIEEIHRAVRRFTTSTFSEPGRALAAAEEHEQLINAIADQRPVDSEEIARKHMRKALEVRIKMQASQP